MSPDFVRLDFVSPVAVLDTSSFEMLSHELTANCLMKRNENRS
ncbi:hypothetical protein FHS27_001855 [Rhodopirellula rubra]|uniref:Uncharacterized protein n=1 Tax=Aporhodopirellula rubra TaxID=980271 RepID=A0A7W5H470_9BACT|nr:hypothetical protein [Aporhodopirellula rubra]